MENIKLKNSFLSMENKELIKYSNAEVININYLASFNFYNADESKNEEFSYINFNLSTSKVVKWQFLEIEAARDIYEEITKLIQTQHINSF